MDRFEELLQHLRDNLAPPPRLQNDLEQMKMSLHLLHERLARGWYTPLNWLRCWARPPTSWARGVVSDGFLPRNCPTDNP